MGLFRSNHCVCGNSDCHAGWVSGIVPHLCHSQRKTLPAFPADHPVRVRVVWLLDDLPPGVAHQKPQPQHQQLALLLGLPVFF